ncbi:helix-turn-helix domain-containing protein [Streptomyces sp. NPDC058525]|uniref:helix-turn-helix domain-containing protein n=1 Tax=Streptomyces sp. NPDC058525 TaxID=3346538 RepID=UPI00364991C2
MHYYTVSEAAELFGVSGDTARRWADAGRFPSARQGSRRLIPGPALAAFCVRLAKENAAESQATTSARNAMPGIVTRVTLGDVAAQVEIQSGPHRVVSLLTAPGAGPLAVLGEVPG